MDRKLKDYALIALKGMGMGAADVVPGVSGGTIAFIVGIYDELINSIKSVNVESLKLLFTGKLAAFARAVNAPFLAALLLGIGISVFSLARIITYLLTNQPVLVWSFFFGLVLASTWLVSKDIKGWNIKTILAFVAGAVAAYLITVATPAQTPTHLLFIFVCGAIAICAMILPGISGSFILVLLGKYFYIMDAVKSLNMAVLLVFAAGCAIGITSFSRLLAYALANFRNITLAILSGFMLGSLNKVWPWKETIETFMDAHGKVQPLIERNIWPDMGSVGLPIVLMLTGLIAVIAIDRLSHLKETK